MIDNVLDISLFSLLFENTFPLGVTFNECGVAQKGLECLVFKSKGLRVTFKVCAVNGLWGGGVSVWGSSWGCGEPIGKNCFKFKSFKECVDSLWTRTSGFIERSHPNSKEFLSFKRSMDAWMTFSFEKTFNSFKEVTFYGS